MATRDQIIAEIWSGNGFPSLGADSVETGVASPLSSDSLNLASTDRYTIVMRDNSGTEIETNLPIAWNPIESNNRLAIYATGHTASFNVGGHDAMIRAMTDAGYTVIGVHMPFASSTDAGATVANHNALPARTESINYLRFFVEPAIRSLNQIGASSFSRVCMTGLSGGGWQSSVLPAIDTRIARSVGVAGSLPLVISQSTRDWEQFLPGLAGELGVDYDDLYLLCCSGNRKHEQLLNTRDSCCFRAAEYNNKPYRMQVRAASGFRFNVTFDSSHNGHIVSAAARAKILELFNQ